MIDAGGGDPVLRSAAIRARIEAGDATVVALLRAADELDRHLAARSSRRLRTTAEWRGVCRDLFDDDLARLLGLTAGLRDDLRRVAYQVSDDIDRLTALPVG